MKPLPAGHGSGLLGRLGRGLWPKQKFKSGIVVSMTQFILKFS
jgi:hypothetical protein